jgi:hypothetical protein
MKTSGLYLAVVPAVLLLATSARAQQEYPGMLQDHLALKYPPPCSLCHAKGNTGTGTVTTPFGWSMRGRGLVADEPQSVTKALDSLRDAHTDSDGDGAADVDELVAGTDPNSAGSIPIPNGEEPGYGCGGEAPNPSRRREGFAPWPLAVAALFALRRVRRAR